MNLKGISCLKKILVCLGIFGVLQLLPFSVVQQAMSQEVYKIGCALPLSGSLAAGGQFALIPAQIAVEEQNKRGGIKGREVKLLVEDTKGTPEGGVAALRKLVEFDKVPIVMSMFTNVVLAQIPYADSKKVVLISSVKSPGIAEKSPWKFVFSLQAEDENALLLDEAERLGIKRLLSYAPNNAWGRLIFEDVKKKWVDQRSRIYENVYFKYGETDYRGAVVRAKAFQPDALFLNGQETMEEGLIIKQSREAGIKAPLFMSVSGLMPVPKKAAGDSFEGAIVSVDAPRSGERFERFAKEFKKRTGEDYCLTAGIWHDIPIMVMQAIDKAGYNSDAIRNYLDKLKNFELTCGGTTSFEGRLARAPLKLYKIKGEELILYSVK